MNNTISTFSIESYERNHFELALGLSFFQSFILLLVAEFSQKTFIMLLIMQMKSDKKMVLISSFIALLGINFLSLLIGFAIDCLLYKNFIFWVGLLIFIFYGLGIIEQAYDADSKTCQTEFLEKMKDELRFEKIKQSATGLVLKKKVSFLDPHDSEALNRPLLRKTYSMNIDPTIGWERTPYREASMKQIQEEPLPNEDFDWILLWSFIKGLIMTECADRAQFSTILMSTVFNIYGVLFGTTLAITMTILLGVYKGDQLSSVFKGKTLTFIVGGLYILYGVELGVLKIYY